MKLNFDEDEIIEADDITLQTPLLGRDIDKIMEAQSDKVLKTNSWVFPLIKCSIKEALLQLGLNIVACPIGTGLAAFSDHRTHSFDKHMFAIFLLYNNASSFTGRIPEIPGVTFNMVRTKNVRVTRQLRCKKQFRLDNQ